MAINAWAPEVEGGEIKGLKWFEHVWRINICE
jgi:hypothetical protein